MARKAEEGLQYYPLNTDIVNHQKVKLIVAEFGPKAWAVLTPLMCKIYREKGYWLDWDDIDCKLLFAKDECQLDVPFVDEVVLGLVRRGFFDKSVFDSFKILTSDRIQENFLEGKRRSKEVKMYEEITLIDINVYTNVFNVSINRKNVNTCTQNRIKENRIKGEGDNASAAPIPDNFSIEQKESFKKFQTWIKENANRVAAMKEPFTIQQYLSLAEKGYDSVKIRELLADMHNWADLHKKRVSAYLTLINWQRRESK